MGLSWKPVVCVCENLTWREIGFTGKTNTDCKRLPLFQVLTGVWCTQREGVWAGPKKPPRSSLLALPLRSPFSHQGRWWSVCCVSPLSKSKPLKHRTSIFWATCDIYEWNQLVWEMKPNTVPTWNVWSNKRSYTLYKHEGWRLLLNPCKWKTHGVFLLFSLPHRQLELGREETQLKGMTSVSYWSG